MKQWPERWLRWSVYALSIAVVIVSWQVAGEHSNPALLASFTDTVSRLKELTESGELGDALLTSGRAFVLGLLISLVIGLPLGLLFARIRILREVVEPYVYALYAVPVITLIPFILAGLGFELRAKLVVVVLASIFPIIISVMEGARSLPSQLLDVARVHVSTERQLWSNVLIPYTTAHAVTGIKQGIAGATVGTVIAEFFLNPNGVGDLLVRGSQTFDSAEVIGVTLVFSLFAVALMGLAARIERRLAPWREGATG